MNVLVILLVLCGEPFSIMVSDETSVATYEYSYSSLVAIVSEYSEYNIEFAKVPLTNMLPGMCV